MDYGYGGRRVRIEKAYLALAMTAPHLIVSPRLEISIAVSRRSERKRGTSVLGVTKSRDHNYAKRRLFSHLVVAQRHECFIMGLPSI
jgi:hypothetical protein